MSPLKSVYLTAALLNVVACHHQRAAVLPQGGHRYEIVGQSATEQEAYANAESEAEYVCKKEDKQMIVRRQQSQYQGADKNAKSDVKGGNVALAIFTGRSGKERNQDDYKVSLEIECR